MTNRELVSAEYINNIVKINGLALVEQDEEIERLKRELKKSEPELRQEVEELKTEMASIFSTVNQFAKALSKAHDRVA